MKKNQKKENQTEHVAQALKEQAERQNKIIEDFENKRKYVHASHKGRVIKKITPTSKKTITIVKTLLSGLVIAFLVVCIFAPTLFGTNDITKALKENIGDVVNVFNFFQFNSADLLKTITKIAVVVIVGFILKTVISIAFKKTPRGKTISRLISSFIKYIVGIIIIWMILAAVGVNTKTLIASAGILALVIGLGAQSMISDILSGLFIIFENAYKIGDIVVIKGFRGTIKEIGLRTTSLVDWQGNLKIVNNSDIKEILNMSEALSVAMCTVDIEYEESIEKVEAIINKNLDSFKERIPNIVKGPIYAGVKELAASGVTLLFLAETTEDNRIQLERDLNKEIKIMFTKNKINIPFPQIVVNKK